MKTFNRFALTLFVAALAIHAAERFDQLVRGDFFAGFAGNQEALTRAMEACDDALAQNPQNAGSVSVAWQRHSVFERPSVQNGRLRGWAASFGARA